MAGPLSAINFSSWLPRGWTVGKSRLVPGAAVLTPNTGRGGYYVLAINPGTGAWDEATYAVRYYPDRGDYPPATLTKSAPVCEAFALIRAGDSVLRAERGLDQEG